jgi:NAD dependent epimerase/dehydratase
MRYKNKKVVVTGSEGFIGSHLVEALVSEGADVTCLVQYNSQGEIGWLADIDSELFQGCKVVHGDVRDEGFVTTLLKSQDIVFHLAALISIPYSYVAPRSYFETNVMGTLNVVLAALSNSVSHVVTTSTSEVYGTATYTPIDENHPLQAQSPYSASKVASDKIAQSFHLSFNQPISVVRPFNTFGPRQSTRALIPSTVIQLLSSARQAHLGDPNPTRDLLHVSDTVEGFMLTGLSEKSVGEVINLSSGEEHSVLKISSSCAEQLGLDPLEALIWKTNARLRPEKSEVQQLLGSNEKAKKLLGWYPRYPFDQALSATIDWLKQPGNLRKYREELIF